MLACSMLDCDLDCRSFLRVGGESRWKEGVQEQGPTSVTVPSFLVDIVDDICTCVSCQQWGLSRALGNDSTISERSEVIVYPLYMSFFVLYHTHMGTKERTKLSTCSWTWCYPAWSPCCNSLYKTFFFSSVIILWATIRFWKKGEMFWSWSLSNFEFISIL